MMVPDPYKLLGDIPGSIRLRVYRNVLAHPNRLIRSFDAVNGHNTEEKENYSPAHSRQERRRLDTATLIRRIQHILAGPWLDVNAAVNKLMDEISRSANLVYYPQILLLEDSSPDHRTHDIVKNPRIAHMISLFRNLNVVVLGNLDFTQIPESSRLTFWGSLQAGQFQLDSLEISCCTLSSQQLAWLISIFGKDHVDKLRIHQITFSEANGSVPLARVQTNAKRALQIRQLFVGIYSPGEVNALNALLNLPTSTLSTRELILDISHVTPDIIAIINNFLLRVHQHVESLFFEAACLSTVEDPRNMLQETPIHLVGVKSFHFDCTVTDGNWNEGLLRLYHGTLARYGNSGLTAIQATLNICQSLASRSNPMTPPIPAAHWLWANVENLMAARRDIHTIIISVCWQSKDYDVHGGRFNDLADPRSNKFLLRRYYPVTLKPEMQREMLRAAIVQLFPNIRPRVVPTRGRAAELSLKVQCNDEHHPASLEYFDGPLFGV